MLFQSQSVHLQGAETTFQKKKKKNHGLDLIVQVFGNFGGSKEYKSLASRTKEGRLQCLSMNSTEFNMSTLIKPMMQYLIDENSLGR